MNTFTFTDDELELLVELVATADDSDQEQLVILSKLSKKLYRMPSCATSIGKRLREEGRRMRINSPFI